MKTAGVKKAKIKHFGASHHNPFEASSRRKTYDFEDFAPCRQFRKNTAVVLG